MKKDKIYTFANVIFKEDDKSTYCYIADFEIHAGDLALVVTSEGKKYTLVAYLTRTTADKAPYPFDQLKHIIGRVPMGAPEHYELYQKYLKHHPVVWDAEAREYVEQYDVTYEPKPYSKNLWEDEDVDEDDDF